MIPHLNDWHAQYEAKGLTIIGVTGEPSSRVESFAQEKEMKYLVGCGAPYGGAYSCKSIPHSWLIGPGGEVLWTGHPSSLNAATVEEHLAKLTLPPAADLPKSMDKANKYIAAGMLHKALGELKKHAKKPKNEGEDLVASQKSKAIEEYGKALMSQAEKAIEGAQFHRALETLTRVQTLFKGNKIYGERAKTRISFLKKGKETKNEVAAAKYILLAEQYARQGEWDTAVAAIQKVTKSKKWADCYVIRPAKKIEKILVAQQAALGGEEKKKK